MAARRDYTEALQQVIASRGGDAGRSATTGAAVGPKSTAGQSYYRQGVAVGPKSQNGQPAKASPKQTGKSSGVLGAAKKAAVDAWYGLVGDPKLNRHFSNQAELERQERQQAARITARNEYMDEQNALLYATKQREKEAAKTAAKEEQRKNSPYYSELEAARKRDAYLDEQKALADNRKADEEEAARRERRRQLGIDAARNREGYLDEQRALLNARKEREKETEKTEKLRQADRDAAAKSYQDEQDALLKAAQERQREEAAAEDFDPVDLLSRSWGKDWLGSLKSTLGTAAEWLGTHSQIGRVLEDPDRYDNVYTEAFEAAIADGMDQVRATNAAEAAVQAAMDADEAAGNGVEYLPDVWDDVTAFGQKEFEEAQGLHGEAGELFEEATKDFSPAGKVAASVAKSGTDLALDAVMNFFLPGSGVVRMYAGAAGTGALEQAERENDDVDARAAKALTSAGAAYLSNKLLGGVEAVYGKSAVGQAIDKLLENAPAGAYKVLKPLLNTEGIEEALEDVLNYSADRILELDPEVQLDWNEVKTDGLVGYILGVVTNGLAGGMSYDSDTLHRIADEAIEFVESGMTIEEAAEIALENAEPVLRANADTETGTVRTEKTPTALMAEERAARHKAEQTAEPVMNEELKDILDNPTGENGQVSNSQCEKILNDPDLRQAFEKEYGISLDGKSKAEQRKTIREAAQEAAQPQGTESPAETENAAGESLTAPEEETAGGEQNPDEISTEESAETEGENPEKERTPLPHGEEERAGPIEGEGETAPEGPVESLLTASTPDQEQAPEAPAQEQQPGQNPNAEQEQQAEQSQEQEQKPKKTLKEKVSQYFSNTLLKREFAGEHDPVTYRPESEVEQISNALTALNEDVQGTVTGLLDTKSWTAEQVHQGRYIGSLLLKQGRETGDMTAYRAWRDIEVAHGSEAGKALRAIQEDPYGTTEQVLRDSEQILDALKKSGVISETQAAETQQQVDEDVMQILDLEERAEALDNSETPNKAEETAIKQAYIDLIIEKLNQRNLSLFADRKRTDESGNRVHRKLRKMLMDEDIDYLNRYARAQVKGLTADLQYKSGEITTAKKLNTFQKLAQLTGTGTWLRNAEGNGTFGLVDLFSNNGVGVVLDQLVSLATGQRSTGFERGALDKNVLKAAHKGLTRSILEGAGNIDLAPDESGVKYDLARTRTYDPNSENGFVRFLSRWEQWNHYMLNSMDELFTEGTKQSSEDAIRRANEKRGNKVNDAEVKETAKQTADYRAFKNKGFAATKADQLRKGLDKAGYDATNWITGKEYQDGDFGIGTAIMPYTGVPTNLAMKGLEFSPAGAAKGLIEIGKVISKARNGEHVSLQEQNTAISDAARGITGTAAIVALGEVMKNGFFKDWDQEEDKDVKAQNKLEGKQGQELNISAMMRSLNGEPDADKWDEHDFVVDISNLEPLNQMLTAAYLISQKEDANVVDWGKAIGETAMESFINQPAVATMKQIEDTIQYSTQEGMAAKIAETAASTAGSIASGFIPAPIRHAAAISDPYVRDTSGNTAIERAWNQTLSAIPGAKQTLPIKTDAYGQEVEAGTLGARAANSLLGAKYRTLTTSEVSDEAARIREETGRVVVPGRVGDKTLTFGTGKEKEVDTLTTEERQRFKEVRGQEYEEAISELMKSEIYQDADWQVKADMWDELYSYAKDAAKADYAKEHGIDYESNYDPIRELTNPAQYLGTKKAFSDANKDGQWDVVDTLLGQVRGGMSKKDRDYLIAHDNDFKKKYEYYEKGVMSGVVNDYETQLKETYTAKGKKSPNGQDILETVASGGFSDHDADVFMTRQESDGDYAAGKGRAVVWQAMREAGYAPDIVLQFWNIIQEADVAAGKDQAAGTLTEKEFMNAVSKIPQPWRDQITKAVRAQYPKW